MKNKLYLYTTFLFLFTFQALISQSEFCRVFFDNTIGVSLTYKSEYLPDGKNQHFLFHLLPGGSAASYVSFNYAGTNVYLSRDGKSSWFSGSAPEASQLSCSSVKVDGYPLSNYVYIYDTYYAKYNGYSSFANGNDAATLNAVIKDRERIIQEVNGLKRTVPGWFADHEELNLNFMIKQSQAIIDEAKGKLRNLSTNNNNPGGVGNSPQGESANTLQNSGATGTRQGNVNNGASGSTASNSNPSNTSPPPANSEQIEEVAGAIISAGSDAVDAISDGISNALDRKRTKRTSGGYNDFDDAAAIGYYAGVHSLIGMEVDLLSPRGNTRWGWGVSIRAQPTLSDRDTNSTGDFRGDQLADNLNYQLIKPEKRFSFSLGGHVNFGITNFMFLQAGLGFGATTWYSVYRITGVKQSGYFEDYVGKKALFRKASDRIMGLTSECSLLFKFSNVMCMKGGVGFYNFERPEFVFGLLLMPDM